MKKRLFAVMLSVLAVSSAWAIEIQTPAGFTPWFSVDGTFIPGEQKIAQPTETLIDWQAIIVVVVASNAVGASAPSDASVETLIAPTGTVPPVQGWTGPVCVKGATPVKMQFTQPAGGVPTRYSFFIKTRNPIGSCAKPGQVTVVP